MKTILLLPLILLLNFVVSINTLQAQIMYVPNKGSAVFYAQDTIAELKTFSATYNSGKVYLKWVVANQHCDGMYIIFRSSDNIHYETIGYKQGIGIPISNNIAYYFTDESPCHEIGYYKFLHINSMSEYILTDAISTLTLPEELCGIKNL